jgi:hypothetical protein
VWRTSWPDGWHVSPCQLPSRQIEAAWVGLCARLGIRHVLTTAYHPQSNGMVERVHRQLKDALRARAAGAAWHSHLPWVLLGLRAAPKEESGCSSAEMVLGMPLQLPGELLLPEQADPDGRQQTLSYAAIADSTPAHLASARFVYVGRGGNVPPLGLCTGDLTRCWPGTPRRSGCV